MNTEDFVTYEQALTLKKLEFDFETHEFYRCDDCKHFLLHDAFANNHNTCEQLASAPTLWQAQKWLREKKELFVFADLEVVTTGKSKFYWYVNDCKGWVIKDEAASQPVYDTYEEALSDGISAAIKLLEESTGNQEALAIWM